MPDGEYYYKNKKIVFKENDKIHADFKIRCEYENITQSKFFRLMIRKLLEKDDRILDLLKEYRGETGKEIKREERQREREKKKREKFEQEFGISDDELRDLYDIFDEG